MVPDVPVLSWPVQRGSEARLPIDHWLFVQSSFFTAKMPFSLQKVLAAGQIHPFYNSSVPYPPSPERVKKLQEDARAGEKLDLKSFKILRKETL